MSERSRSDRFELVVLGLLEQILQKLDTLDAHARHIGDGMSEIERDVGRHQSHDAPVWRPPRHTQGPLMAIDHTDAAFYREEAAAIARELADRSSKSPPKDSPPKDSQATKSCVMLNRSDRAVAQPDRRSVPDIAGGSASGTSPVAERCGPRLSVATLLSSRAFCGQ